MSDRPIPDWQVVPSNAGVHVHLNVLPSSVQVPSFPHGFGLQALISKDKDAINSDGIGMSTFMCYTCFLHWYNQIRLFIYFQIKSVPIIAKLSLNFRRSKRNVAY